MNRRNGIQRENQKVWKGEFRKEGKKREEKQDGSGKKQKHENMEVGK